MNMQSTLRRFWIQLSADRKKFGLLCTMLAVGLLLWARIIVISNVPRTATATGENKVGAAATLPEDVIRDSSARTTPGREPISLRMDRTPRRDPFVIDQDFFPKPTIADASSAEANKLPAHPAEDAESREARRQARLEQALAGLKLEAVMTGASVALINGQTYRVGASIPAGKDQELEFVLKDVRQRTVLLEFEGRKFELRMTQPGQS